MTGANDTAASFGGPGFRPRTGTHADDVRRGLWGACGVSSEGGVLREVLLAQPGTELEFDAPPDSLLMLGRIDLPRMRAQTAALAAAYRAEGVVVHVHDPVRRPPPNWIFLRDLFFMTPEGAVLARTATDQRAGEERFAAEALATLGIPVLATPRGEAVFEGADALWLDPRTVLVGLGRRTNEAGLRLLERVLGETGVTVVGVEIGPSVQHLLGAVNFLAPGLAAVFAEAAPASLRRELSARGVRCVELGGTEVVEKRSMNFVASGPRRIVMPAGCPATRATFEHEGVRCVEVDVSEYVLAAGAIGCATGIVRRDPPEAGA